MENYPITISRDKAVHYDGKTCKIKVFEHGDLVASFNPDEHQFLPICQNPGGLEEELFYLLANQIAAHYP